MRIGVILSGCGFRDGSEIHEAVCSLLAIDRAGAEAVCYAPDKPQASVVDHRTGKAVRESRNVLAEAARIARGRIRDLAGARAADVDAVLLPGGYGAASNLCTFSTEGASGSVDPQVARFLREVHAAGKPIGALCIAPSVLALLFGKDLHPTLTIGDDAETAGALEGAGARHQAAVASGVVVDRKNKIVSSPCYMFDARISEVADGAGAAVRELVGLL